MVKKFNDRVKKKIDRKTSAAYIARVLNTDQIRERREYLNLTQERAAAAAGFKSKQQWYAIEKGDAGGKSGITLSTLNAIARALSCDPRDLLA